MQLIKSLGVLILVLLWPLLAGAEVRPQLSKVWSLEGQFSAPESAVFDPLSKHILVSNVNGYALDGNGFISRISADGNKLELRWLAGINSPTGLAINAGKLYFADYDHLLVADLDSGEILERYRAPDPKPALNDVAITETGQVFVSGSASATIYTLSQEGLEVWKHDLNLLAQANGLYARNGQLVHGGAKWSVFDIESKQRVPQLAQPTEFKDIDGIADDGCGGYLVTLLADKRLWQVHSNGTATPYSEQPVDGIDLQHHAGHLFIPRVGNSLTVYRIADISCDAPD